MNTNLHNALTALEGEILAIGPRPAFSSSNLTPYQAEQYQAWSEAIQQVTAAALREMDQDEDCAPFVTAFLCGLSIDDAMADLGGAWLYNYFIGLPAMHARMA